MRWCYRKGWRASRADCWRKISSCNVSIPKASEYTGRCCLLCRRIIYSNMLYCQVSRFSPSGDRILSVKIQKLSLSLLRRVPPWWIFSMPLTSTSFVWWSRRQKWAATGLSVFFGLDIWTCSFILMCRGCFVSPTYCRLHLCMLWTLLRYPDQKNWFTAKQCNTVGPTFNTFSEARDSS